MSRLHEIRQKYKMEGGKYEPNPDCKFCKGAGEKLVKRTGKLNFCVCLFVAPDFSNELGDLLGRFAKKALSELR